MKRIFSASLLASALALSALSVSAEESAPEKAKLCVACHGAGGSKPILPEYPIIGGQYPNYLKLVLEQYKDGSRKDAVMNAQAASLSDDEIEALAKYYGRQESPLYTPSIPGHKAN